MTRPAFAEVPPRLDDADECVGCGNEKQYRGRAASSLICCHDCWKRIPVWMRDAWHMESAKVGGDPMKWQDRIALFLNWLNEAHNGPREEADDE